MHINLIREEQEGGQYREGIAFLLDKRFDQTRFIVKVEGKDRNAACALSCSEPMSGTNSNTARRLTKITLRTQFYAFCEPCALLGWSSWEGDLDDKQSNRLI